MPSSQAARTKIDEKSFENRRTCTPNRQNIDLEPLWSPQAVSGTRPDTLGTAFGRPNVVLRPIWGRPGRAKSDQEPSKRVFEPPQRRSKSLLVRRPIACGAPGAVERAFGPIFRRFCFAARKQRCAFRISFNGVLLTSDEVSTLALAQQKRTKIEAFRP